MNRGQAELLAKELNILFMGERVVLVECLEFANFIPKVVTGNFIKDIRPVHGQGEESTLEIEMSDDVKTEFLELGHPVIEGRAVIFTTANNKGQKIYRAFALERDSRDEKELHRWIFLKHAII